MTYVKDTGLSRVHTVTTFTVAWRSLLWSQPSTVLGRCLHAIFPSDVTDDGGVTRLEFDTVWKRESFPDSAQSPANFLEIDINRDVILDDSDFAYLFKLFDENGEKSVLGIN